MGTILHISTKTTVKDLKKITVKIFGIKLEPNLKLYKGGKIKMWQVKTFASKQAMQNFINKNKNKIQYQEIFINNGYAVEYRLLRVI